MADQPVAAATAGPEETERGGRAYSTAVLGLLALAGVAVAVNGALLGPGTASEPGPGLWPMVIGTVWASAGLVVCAAAWFKGLRLDRLDKLGKPALGAGLSVLFVVLFSYVGFLVATVATLVLWLRLISSFAWRRVLIVTAVITALFYLLFAVIIGTAFPAALLG